MAQGVGEVGGAGGAGGSAKAGGASGFYVADGGEVRYWPVVVGRPVMYIFSMPVWNSHEFKNVQAFHRPPHIPRLSDIHRHQKIAWSEKIHRHQKISQPSKEIRSMTSTGTHESNGCYVDS